MGTADAMVGVDVFALFASVNVTDVVSAADVADLVADEAVEFRFD